MIKAFITQIFRGSSTSRACSSQDENHGIEAEKHEKAEQLPKNKNTVNGNKGIADSQSLEHQKQHAPLVTTLKDLAKQNVVGFHFPGDNRGRAAPSSLSDVIGLQPFLHDLTALPELGNLFSLDGPIMDAQKRAAELFGAKETWFLVGGTTCGIQASIMATCSPGDTLILPRNAHVSVFYSMVLSGAIPSYINPEYDFEWDVHYRITSSQVEKAIKEAKTEGRKVSAVLVTSPTYHGICSNLQNISFLCHSHNIPMIVDEAHGAHLAFHDKFPSAALSQGADIAVQSTHKVLGSLQQSSMLHMSGNIVNRERICQCLQALQSTSPNYLLLASLDAARAQISERPETIFSKSVEIAKEAKSLIENIRGIEVLNCDDPLRITIGVWKLGITGFEANDILYNDYGIIAELPGTRSLMFAVNLGNSRDDVSRLILALKHLSQTYTSVGLKEKILRDIVIRPYMESVSGMSLSPREAFFASKKKIKFEESIGKVCGELICPYPPGIPLLIPGEVITEEALSYLVEVKNKGGFVIGVADPNLSSIVVCS